jgi:hypothetical protein
LYECERKGVVEGAVCKPLKTNGAAEWSRERHRILGRINECEEAGRRSQEAAGSAIAITEHVTIRVTSLSRNYSKAFKVKGMQALRKRVAAWGLAGYIPD